MTLTDDIKAKVKIEEILGKVIAGKLKTGAKLWDLLSISSTPICSEPDESGNCLCTFIYRGNERTRTVQLELPPYSRISPERFVMSRAAESDIWYIRAELPAKARFMYGFAENVEDGAAVRDLLKPDEFNSLIFGRRSCIETHGAAHQSDIIEGLDLIDEDVQECVFQSRILQNRRHLWVYKTPDFDSAKSSSLLICFDAETYLNDIKAAAVLNELSEQGLISQTVALFVGNAEGRRDVELTANNLFAEFVVNELFDQINKKFLISESPADRIVCGASFGGLASLHLGLSYPDVFGGIIAQSASLWRSSNELSEIANNITGQKPLIYMDAGCYEIEQRNGNSLLEANRIFSNTLKTMGFEVIYQEFNGGHGAANWRGTFPNAVIKLFGNQPKPKSAAVRTELF